MARRHQQEDHVNHEAWAIPYGDLVTLLLAFFVVMYSISSVNEGKYRAVSDALSSAFGGPPRSISPLQLGQTQLRGSSFDRPSPQTAGGKAAPAPSSPVAMMRVQQVLDMPTFGKQSRTQATAKAAEQRALRERDQQLNSLGEKIQQALTELMRQKLVTVRRGRTFLEVEIQSDILFASGVAEPSAMATSTVRKLAAVLRDTPNALRVEGYTDNQPIHTAQFLSNWELSAARAASVVHVLAGEGVSAQRMAVVGYGEHQPVSDNTTVAGRNANRRVLLVILGAPQGPDAVPEAGPTIAFAPQPAPEAPAAGVRQRAAAAPPPATGTAHAAARSNPPGRAATRAPVRIPGVRQGTGVVRHRASEAPSTSVAAQLAPQPGAG